MRDSVIRLLAIVASAPADNFDRFAVDKQEEYQRRALRQLYLLRDKPVVWSYFKKINDEEAIDESQDATLRRASRIAGDLLRQLMAEAEQQNNKTAKEKYQHSFAATDPFLEDAHLTNDAISPRLAPEEEPKVHFDAWGYIAE